VAAVEYVIHCTSVVTGRWRTSIQSFSVSVAAWNFQLIFHAIKPRKTRHFYILMC